MRRTPARLQIAMRTTNVFFYDQGAVLTTSIAIAANTTVGPNADNAVALLGQSSKGSGSGHSSGAGGQSTSRSTSGQLAVRPKESSRGGQLSSRSESSRSGGHSTSRSSSGQLAVRSKESSGGGQVSSRSESSHGSTSSRNGSGSKPSTSKESSRDKSISRSSTKESSQRSAPAELRRKAAVAPAADPIYEEEEYDDYPEDNGQQIASGRGKSYFQSREYSQSQAGSGKEHSLSVIPTKLERGASQTGGTSQDLVRRSTNQAVVPHQPYQQPAPVEDDSEEMIVKRRYTPFTTTSCPDDLFDALKKVFKVTNSKVKDW